MNLPNALTLSRIFFAGVIIFLLEKNTPSGNVWAAIVFAMAAITDFYDGHLAKTRGLISDFGKIMDPIADKVLILSTFGVLAHLGMVIWWMFIVIAIREIAVTVSRIVAMRHGQVLAAERAGKIKTVSQIVAISSILLYLVAQHSEFCAYWFYPVQRTWLVTNYTLTTLATILTLYSGFDYFRRKK